MSYSKKVLDHFNNPRNMGSLDKSSNDVGTGVVGAPECGDVMKLQVKVNPTTGVEPATIDNCPGALAQADADALQAGGPVDAAMRFLIVLALVAVSGALSGG